MCARERERGIEASLTLGTGAAVPFYVYRTFSTLYRMANSIDLIFMGKGRFDTFNLNLNAGR